MTKLTYLGYFEQIDLERMEAEADPQNADWESLARRYMALGRFAQAEKCFGRANYYKRTKQEDKNRRNNGQH